jgi:hypothetical protein
MPDQTYEIHTNRELEFMLRRGKPLAHFVDDHPAEPNEDIIPEGAFEPYVQSGKFVKRDYAELGRLRHLFYALPAEEWRIDAFIAMLSVAAKTGWSEGFERLEGKLLGYEDWQTDIHLERLRAGPHAVKFPWLRRSDQGKA